MSDQMKRDNSQEGAHRGSEAIENVADRASQAAKDAVDRASNSVKQTAKEANNQLQQVTHDARQRADQVKANAAQSLAQAAQNLREQIGTSQGPAVQQAEYLANSLEQVSKYLETNSFEHIEKDIRTTIQKNPWQSVGVAAFFGFILARLFGGGSKRR
ncbi:MAG TPA: DUF883 C-terminal domain-containing protein [Aggregatilineales bacterium]|nr:DUF883 C-terminal domain-containing protein [Aggregatilineales bacterium]